MPRTLIAAGVLVCLSHAVQAESTSRDLTFEQRVQAQEAIERVYFSHLVGTRRPFEDAVPRSVLEQKVRASLTQSTAVTARSLKEEMERIETLSLFPERLEEIYAALDHDPVVIEETFARASLADRLTLEQASVDAPKLDKRRRREGDAGEATANPHCRPDDTWDTSLMSVPGPAPMSGQLAIWTGNEMIVWANNREGGARFNPLTGTWRFLPEVEGPDEGAAFWTGQEMLIWGRIYAIGEDLHAVLKLGGALYDPIADSWRPVSPDVPVRSKNASAVWTGRELIVWGGDTSGPEADDAWLTAAGARYDPDADSWMTTSLAGAPAAREGHVAVWTGTDMIVWGGYDDDEPVSNGARYDPATDSWSGMSQAGPQTDYDTAVVWTGHEMIVSGYPRAAYAPDTDTWRPLSTVLAPFYRYGSSLTQAGDFVILWGGYDGIRHKEVNTGSRYHPASDTWTPMSARLAPSPRSGHRAIWTGKGLIVCSGWSSYTPTGTGGVYFVDNDLDGDGFTRCHGDCDDASAAVHPGTAEVPGNSLDEDCDGRLVCDPRASWRSSGDFQRCVALACAIPGPADECRKTLRLTDRGCGNGIRGDHELCDGDDLDGTTCQGLGYTGGTLGCQTSCDEFDVSACTTLCGNGVREPLEVCDGPDLREETCQSLGFDGGTLACHGSCQGFDQALCTTMCGDGVRRGDEACDGEDFGRRSCESLGFDGGALACGQGCDRLDASGCTTSCGDDARSGSEVCDGDDIGQFLQCTAFGFDEGTLECRTSCDGYDTSGCARCGDGVKGGSEICDRTDFGGETCQGLGFQGGTLSCSWDCMERSLHRCIGCGNDQREDTEVCDGSDFGTSCKGMGFDGGTLRCSASCDAIDTSNCTTCGDGVKDWNEACDGNDLGGRTCQNSGYDGGTLRCLSNCTLYLECTTVCGDGVRRGWEVCDGEVRWPDNQCWRYGYDYGTVACNQSCNGYDFSPCTRCGDGVREFPEECEGAGDSAGQTCVSLGRGYVGGALACDPDSCRFDTSGCVSVCGDGVIAGHERCDGNDFGDRSCLDFGFDGGTLTCSSDCGWYTTNGCTSVCGNGVRGPGELCDGADVGQHYCYEEGFGGGTLTCNATCDGYDTSGCARCGDGQVTWPEVCDGANLQGWTCQLFGYQQGVLGCSTNCGFFDESLCVGD